MGKKRKSGKYSSINKHRIEGKRVIHPMSSKVAFFDWDRDLLPEHLWIDGLAQTYADLNWVDFFDTLLDIIEENCRADFMLLGTISDFGKVPKSKREEILKVHKEYIITSFAKPVGKILSLYPECPANWLLPPEWLTKTQIDKNIELKKLESALLRLYRAKDSYCGYLRTMPF